MHDHMIDMAMPYGLHARETQTELAQIRNEGCGRTDPKVIRLLVLITAVFFAYFAYAVLPAVAFNLAMVGIALYVLTALVGCKRIVRVFNVINWASLSRPSWRNRQYIRHSYPKQQNYTRPQNAGWRGVMPVFGRRDSSAPVTKEGNVGVGNRSGGTQRRSWFTSSTPTPATTREGNVPVGGRSGGVNNVPPVTREGNAPIGGRAVGVNNTPPVTRAGNAGIGTRKMKSS